MPLVLSPDHFSFFFKHNYIEFDSLLSPKTSQAVLEELKATLGDTDTLLKQDSQALFLKSHDLLRKNQPLLLKVLTKDIIETAKALFAIEKPRFAFDQWLISTETPICPVANATWKEISSIKPLKGLILISLQMEPRESLDHPYLPQKAGNVTFFKPEYAPFLPPLFEKPGQIHLIIGLGDDKIFCHYNTQDPFVHSLKKEGFVFGDELPFATHPPLKGH